MADRDFMSFFRACQTGKLEDAMRIADEINITGEEVRSCGNLLFIFTCSNGHLDVARWLAEKYEFTSEDTNYALTMTADIGHAHVVRWLLDFLEPNPNELAVIYMKIHHPLPAIRDVFATWRLPPGPGDKPAQD